MVQLGAGWKIDGVLRALYHCFHDPPARREDYLEANDGNALFGLKFCSTRWLEDVPVAERAIQIWPQTQKYVTSTQKMVKSKRPTCQSYVNLCEYVQDPLMLAKLNFFVCIAKILVPFLELFQTDKPMMPFMSSELQKILNNLLGRFIKKSVLDKQRNVAKVDVGKKDNIVAADKVGIGFAAKQAIDGVVKAKRASQLQVFEFYQGCVVFLQNMTEKLLEKLLERRPLKFKTVRAMNALNPLFIASHPEKSQEKMEIILKKLLNTKWLSPGKCDDASQEFKLWTREMKLHNSDSLSSFDSKNDRIDDFFYNHLGSCASFKTLWFALQLILILSHGQSSVERGFSTNKDILKNSMTKYSLVAYRHVYDGLIHLSKSSGSSKERKITDTESRIDVWNISITKKMLDSCRHARARYNNFLEDEKKKKVASAEQVKKKQLQEVIATLNSRKRKLESSVGVLLREADDLIQEAEKKMKMDLIVKSNAFRVKSKEKQKEIEKTSREIEKLEKALSGI